MLCVSPIIAFTGDPTLQQRVKRYFANEVKVPVIDLNALDALSRELHGYPDLGRDRRIQAELNTLQQWYHGPIVITHTDGDHDFTTINNLSYHARLYHVHHLGDASVDELTIHTPMFITYINKATFQNSLSQLVMH